MNGYEEAPRGRNVERIELHELVTHRSQYIDACVSATGRGKEAAKDGARGFVTFVRSLAASAGIGANYEGCS